MKIRAALLIGTMVLPGFGQVPAADDILRTARQVTALQEHDLSGQLRKGSLKIPVQLYLRKENIQFQFLDAEKKSWVVFHMRLKKDRYDLFEIRAGKTVKFPDAKLKETIRGTDLSYEDLAMRFLYWPNGQVVGEDQIATRHCWKVRLQNPRQGVGRYALVYAWIDKKTGALIQVVGYNDHDPAKALKRFQVQRLMQVGKAHTLKTMRVDSFAPVGGKAGITYLEFEKPKKAGPSGLR